jgi:hypothetical protein
MHFYHKMVINRCRLVQKYLIVINKNVRGCGGSSIISSSNSSTSNTIISISSTIGSTSITNGSCSSSGGSSSDGSSSNSSSSNNDDVGSSLRQSDLYSILIHTDLLPTPKAKCLLKACSRSLLVFWASPCFTLTPLNFIRHSHPSWWYHELFTATFRLTSSPVMGHAAIPTL